ncbi:MAG TPA: alpha/beta fold hydrolase [Candidatus Thermoplasmatota archaeon]|nr:alpha/beta fold hydrolase [Candidatus Thermoplasmatota archaeon]
MREARFDVDGESVAGALFETKAKPLGQLVLVHGFLSQRGEFADLGERLAEKGWRCLAIDNRGFGASGGARGRISAPRAIADVKGALRWLDREQPGLPLGLIGHSMGACFALGAMATEPLVKAAVLAAPMASVRAEVNDAEFLGYKVARAASNFSERLGLGSIKVPYKYRERHLFKDSEAVKRAEEAGFLGKRIDLGNFNDLLDMDSRDYAPHVKRPVMVLLAEADRAVKHASSLLVYEALGGEKEIARVDTGHSMFGDAEAAAAVAHVDRWFRHHLLAKEAA